jgi:hypothetical protein
LPVRRCTPGSPLSPPRPASAMSTSTTATAPARRLRHQQVGNIPGDVAPLRAFKVDQGQPCQRPVRCCPGKRPPESARPARRHSAVLPAPATRPGRQPAHPRQGRRSVAR